MIANAIARCGVVGVLLAGLVGWAGCEQDIEHYNPRQNRVGVHALPTPAQAEGDLPRLTRASEAKVLLRVDEHNEPDDQIVLVNQSDGAIYGLKLVVNNDYTYTLPLLEMGQTVRVPEGYLRTDAGKPFPSEQRTRMERVIVYHDDKVVAFYDQRNGQPPK